MFNVIANAHAGKGQKEAIKDVLSGIDHKLFWTEHLRHAEELTAKVGRRDPESILIAAGGDGTVNEVISGLATLKNPPVLGILPLGTGNDLCRSLDIPLDPQQAMQTILLDRRSRIDLGSVNFGSKTLYFANASAVGFSSAVGEVMEGRDKKIWGALAYLKAGMEAILDFEPLDAKVILDDEAHNFCAFNFVIANGRFVAGGIPVAPEAFANDGAFDFVAFLGDNKLEQIAAAPSVIRGNHIESDKVFFGRAKKIRLEINQPMMINVDGELADQPVKSMTYSILPGALTVFTGLNPEAVDAIPAQSEEKARPIALSR